MSQVSSLDPEGSSLRIRPRLVIYRRLWRNCYMSHCPILENSVTPSVTSSVEDGANADRAKKSDKEYQYLRKETMIKDWSQFCPHFWATELIRQPRQQSANI